MTHITDLYEPGDEREPDAEDFPEVPELEDTAENHQALYGHGHNFGCCVTDEQRAAYNERMK